MMSTPNEPKNKNAKRLVKARRQNELKLNTKFDKPRASAKRHANEFVEANPTYQHKKVKQYLKNTLVNSRPIRGPTFGSQTSSLAHFQTSGVIPPNVDGTGALLFTNNPHFPIAYLSQDANPIELAGSNANHRLTTTGTSYQIDGMKDGDEAVGVQMGIFAYSTYHYYDKQGLTRPGVACFPGRFSSATLRFDATATGGTITVRFLFAPSLESQLQYIQHETITVVEGINEATFAIDYPTGYYGFVWYISSPTGNVYTANDYIELTTSPGYTWKPVPLLINPETQLLLEWINSCSQLRIPAADLLLSNFNADIYKNGKIGAVFVPPDEICKLPHDPTECYRYITTSPQKVQKAVNMPLAEGIHVPWIGFDTKSFEFHPNMHGVITEQSVDMLSGWLIAWRANDVNVMEQPMDFFLNMSIEGVTRQTILPALACPHLLELWNHWNQYKSRHCLISENPKHLRNAANKVTNFLKDKNNQEMLLKAGIALATALVTAI